MNNQRGMTLVEITIVMAILAFIASVAFSTIGKSQRKAKISQTKIIIADVIKALDQYNTDCQFYPGTEQGLQALVQAPQGGKPCANWGPESYLKKVPTDAWGNPFQYSSEGNKFIVKSLGSDGKEGGSGYDTDLNSEDL